MDNFSKYTFKEDGTVVSHRGKLLSHHYCKKGYARVNLRNNSGKKGTYLVHRLIALEHIPNPDNLPQVNHINGDKKDNSVANLEWCTPQYNVEHSVINGLVKRGPDRVNSKLTLNQVAELRRLRSEEKLSYYELGRRFSIAYQTAHKVCTNQTYKP